MEEYEKDFDEFVEQSEQVNMPLTEEDSKLEEERLHKDKGKEPMTDEQAQEEENEGNQMDFEYNIEQENDRLLKIGL